jgi:hypothetical protein
MELQKQHYQEGLFGVPRRIRLSIEFTSSTYYANVQSLEDKRFLFEICTVVVVDQRGAKSTNHPLFTQFPIKVESAKRDEKACAFLIIASPKKTTRSRLP